MPAPVAPPPLLLPRGLIFLASLWLIGSWMLTIGVGTPIQPVSASYTPAVRMMLLSMVIGLVVGWPLLRLSQRAAFRPMAQTALDLLVLLALAQVVIWPLRLVTPWSIGRTAALDATISGWVALAGAVLASAIGSSGAGPRCLAMAACLAFCLLGPLLVAAGTVSGLDALARIDLSPVMAVRSLGGGAGEPPSQDEWRSIILLLTTAAVSWATLLAYGLRGRRRT